MGAVCIASLLAVPSLTVLGSLSQPSSDVWVHLWRTQLLELIANTLAIAVWARTSASLWSAAAPALDRRRRSPPRPPTRARHEEMLCFRS
ncbi:MAG: hypothetical protein DME07_09620 [Candidatus Rokuibacteriota bacterium]|nr:MAG: hypothetical protein DME07_09620 [Candidatus Rokubacteria bacterium]